MKSYQEVKRHTRTAGETKELEIIDFIDPKLL